ncbi:preprotein translocase subunit YajC [Fusibacter ferrireducens]|uniref:Preprotein translocase subunit YajC n=1 Tax=Fusibacter ferrireducens TaxID=2785058 RepID=A0ABR9ZTJ3_9FIRM|nr:preprotein translocase subunit YajC [Fusibacter ferrireducens]MBF4693770.1 preprotein translocase subunit YajC [Fusibacter ferrireducens]
MGTLGLVAYIAFFFGLMYFLMIRPQNKKNKQLQELRSNLKQGDEVVTIGGISGRILNVKEDDVVLEIGAAKTKLTFKKWAISTVEHSADAPVAEIEQTTSTEE